MGWRSLRTKVAVGASVAGAALLAFPAVAGAQDEVDPAVTALGQQLNLMWIVIGAVRGAASAPS